MRVKKGKPEKIRPYEGDKELAEKIAQKTGLDVIDIMSLALSAGLKAIDDHLQHGGQIVPLKFKVVPDSSTYPETRDHRALAADDPKPPAPPPASNPPRNTPGKARPAKSKDRE